MFAQKKKKNHYEKSTVRHCAYICLHAISILSIHGDDDDIAQTVYVVYCMYTIYRLFAIFNAVVTFAVRTYVYMYIMGIVGSASTDAYYQLWYIRRVTLLYMCKGRWAGTYFVWKVVRWNCAWLYIANINVTRYLCIDIIIIDLYIYGESQKKIVHWLCGVHFYEACKHITHNAAVSLPHLICNFVVLKQFFFLEMVGTFIIQFENKVMYRIKVQEFFKKVILNIFLYLRYQCKIKLSLFTGLCDIMHHHFMQGAKVLMNF